MIDLKINFPDTYEEREDSMTYLKYILFLALTLLGTQTIAAHEGPFKLPPLPYQENALEPYISEKTLKFHYGKHHQGYVNKLNKLVAELNLQGKSLEEVILLSAKDPSLINVFHNAAQDWNHSFYWKSMKKNGGGMPKEPLLSKITKQFGSYENFKKEFVKVGTQVFGSGWVWLVQNGEVLTIVPTADADLPLTENQNALLNCDVWEHAYYLDYQNRRKDYMEVFLDHLVNWDFALQNLKK